MHRFLLRRWTPPIFAALALLAVLSGGARVQAEEGAATGGTLTLTVWICNEFTPDPYSTCQNAFGAIGPITFSGPVSLSTDIASIQGTSWVWGDVEPLPFGDYYLQGGLVTPPAGYYLANVIGSAGGSDIGYLAPLDESNPNAQLAMVFAPVYEPEPDSDGDGMVDELEFNYGTDPYLFDTDGDGLGDGGEVLEGGTGTDPFVWDTDGDGFGDGHEVEAGSDPLDSASVPQAPTPDTEVLIKVHVCPVDFNGVITWENCPTVATDVAVDLVPVGDDFAYGATTDAAGEAFFGPLVARDYVAHLGVPGDFAEFQAGCALSTGEEVIELSSSTSNQLEIPIPTTGGHVGCVWFILPVDAGQPGQPVEPTPAPQPTQPGTPVKPSTPAKPVTALPNTGTGEQGPTTDRTTLVWLGLALTTGLGLLGSRTIRRSAR